MPPRRLSRRCCTSWVLTRAWCRVLTSRRTALWCTRGITGTGERSWPTLFCQVLPTQRSRPPTSTRRDAPSRRFLLWGRRDWLGRTGRWSVLSPRSLEFTFLTRA
uniref:Putative secreted protein n=1 Tax=Ixodes scapularis TaxID=6945 RepID=A0A4D5S5L8_IXOSC